MQKPCYLINNNIILGPEAQKAVVKATMLQGKLDSVKSTIESPSCNLTQKEMVKIITDLTEDISAATISYWRKDEMRTALKSVKKTIDDKNRARKAALMTECVETMKTILGENKDLPYIVHVLNACAQNKAMDGALKQVIIVETKMSSSIPDLFFFSILPAIGQSLEPFNLCHVFLNG